MLARSLLLGLALMASTALAAEKVFDFGAFKLNELPPGFRSTVVGEGKPGDWKIILDDAPTAFPPVTPGAISTSKQSVLAQTSRDKTDEHFPLLIYDEESFGDFTLTTRFKLVDGQAEQMAGIAFRVQDEKNFYYVRATALPKKSFGCFRYVNGQRLIVGVVTDVNFSQGTWHEISVECKDSTVAFRLDQKPVLPPITDLFIPGGKLGFITKSDAVTYFSNVRIAFTRKECVAQTLVDASLSKYPRLEGVKIFAVPDGKKELELIASTDRTEIGRAGGPTEQDVLTRGQTYYGKDTEKGTVIVMMPLRDRNGEPVAAVKVLMKPSLGTTEKLALAKVRPILKLMEERVQTLKDLVQ